MGALISTDSGHATQAEPSRRHHSPFTTFLPFNFTICTIILDSPPPLGTKKLLLHMCMKS